MCILPWRMAPATQLIIGSDYRRSCNEVIPKTDACRALYRSWAKNVFRHSLRTCWSFYRRDQVGTKTFEILAASS